MTLLHKSKKRIVIKCSVNLNGEGRTLVEEVLFKKRKQQPIKLGMPPKFVFI